MLLPIVHGALLINSCSEKSDKVSQHNRFNRIRETVIELRYTYKETAVCFQNLLDLLTGRLARLQRNKSKKRVRRSDNY